MLPIVNDVIFNWQRYHVAFHNNSHIIVQFDDCASNCINAVITISRLLEMIFFIFMKDEFTL